MSYSKQNTRVDFDFEEWSSLANDDPEEFEQRRQDFINAYIERFPGERQRRMRGLQFRIDMERKRARTPLAACIKLSSMMWDSVTGENGFVSTVKMLIDDNESSKNPVSQKQNATILPFDRSKIRH